MAFNYPIVRRDENFSETIFNVKIKDPYRWLENNDEEVQKFIDQQNSLTLNYLNKSPSRKKIIDKLKKLYDYKKFSCPFKKKEYYYIFKNTGLQNQSILYRVNCLYDINKNDLEIFLDPNTINTEGTINISKVAFSEDGNYMAYAITEYDSDWLQIYIRNVDTKTDLPEVLKNCKFTEISWTHDSKGFFYSKYDKGSNLNLKETDMNTNHKLYYHRINTPQDEDILVYSIENEPKLLIVSNVSHCGNYLIVCVLEKCRDSQWMFCELNNQPITQQFDFIFIINKFDADYEYITNKEKVFYFKTDKDAPFGKIAKINLDDIDTNSWVDAIPEIPNAVLDNVFVIDNDKLVLNYMINVCNKIEIRTLDGNLFLKFDIPFGTIKAVTCQRNESELFFLFCSFLNPGSLYYYNFSKDDRLKILKRSEISFFNFNKYITRQVFFTSKDGEVQIPMFITHSKEIDFNKQNPCLVHSYGGFNLSLRPYFSAGKLLFLEKFKGILVVVNVRGGGEYGSDWYEKGRLLNKQKSFDDLTTACEYLIENNYTCKDKLILEGASNGGLMAAACANQRPDLIGAIISSVGVYDLLRYDKFTIGYAWASDFGSPEEEIYFKNLVKYSPLHNVPDGCYIYPATFLLTSEYDSRVVPLHSYKFISELQYKIGRYSSKPILLNIQKNVGHSQGKSVTKTIEELVDMYSFLENSLELKFFD